MKQSQKTSMMGSTLIRLMLVLLLALSLFAFAACQKNDQGENENEEPNGNVETPDDPSGHEHVFGEWVTTQNPSCTVAGTKERVCTVEGCGKKETASIDPLGHDVVNHAAKAATCTAIGWNAYETCSRCDYTTYQEIGALGHDIVHHDAQAVSCTAIGWDAYDTCARCNYTTYQEIGALGHKYEDHFCVRCSQLDPTYYTDGLIFELSENDTYSVTGYNGAATDVVIPVTYRNNPVTLIRCGAFEQKGLTTILIPEGVTRVESKAFSYCPSLTSLNIPQSLTIIEESAFQRCNGLTSINVAGNNPKFHSAGNCLIETERKTLVLGCRNSVIPADDSVEKIGSYAFSGCSNLTSITIPGNVTIIGRGAFQDSGLISIIFSDGVVEFKEGAFAGCSNLTSIVFPKSVGMIENGAFYNCNRLTKVYYCGLISDNFGGNSSGNVFPYATRYYYSETEPTSDDDWWHYVDGAPTVWPRKHTWEDWTTTKQPTCTETGEKSHTCTTCNRTETAEIPALGHNYNENNVCTRCGQLDPSYYTEGLSFILLQNDTYSVSKYNGSADDVVIPSVYQNKTVTAIEGEAFHVCQGMTSVIIPESVTKIASNSFEGCSGLTSITVSGNNSYYHSIDNCLIETASKTLVLGCRNSIIPTDGSVTAIGDYAFQGCSGLSSINIPDSVITIGRRTPCP